MSKCEFFAFRHVGRVTLALGFAVVLLAYCSLPLLSQNLESTASLSGTVTDPQGARVRRATVLVTSPDRGITRTFTSDNSGTFSFTLLPPGIYTLNVQAPGFRKFAQDQITLEVGQAATLNVSLTLGNVQETVQVTGEAPLLNTDNANIASEISQKQILDLPLNQRNPFFLTFLDSSVKNIDEGYMGAGLDNNDQAVAFLNFSAQFLGWTAFVLDGGWDTEMTDGLVAYVPSVDDVQEFKVQTNSFTAQYGLSAGNVINVITKSGTSHFHGDVFEFLRNSALDANYFFNNYNGVPKSNLHLSQFGASGGGPLYIPRVYTRKDRTFFFVLYEGYRSKGTSPDSLTTPDSAFKTGDLSGLLGAQIGTDALCRPIYSGQIYNPQAYQTTATCGPQIGKMVEIRDPIANNNLTSMINSVSKNFLPFFPAPTNSNLFNNFYAVQAVPITSDEFTTRIDHNFTQNSRLYGRFSRKWESQTSVGELYGANDPGGPGQVSPNNRYSIALGYNQVISPSFTASVNGGFQRWISGSVAQGYPYKPSSLGLPGELDAISPIFPSINFSADVNPLLANLTSAYAPLGSPSQGLTPDEIGTLSADLSKVHGAHTFSFGYMGTLRRIIASNVSKTSFSFTQAFTSGPDPTNPTSGTGDAFASFLLGAAEAGSTGIVISPSQTQISHGWYFQDNWKATKKLTLNLGLRYDIQLAPTEKYNRQAYFSPTAVNPISSLVGQTYLGELVYNSASARGNFQQHFDNFAPRFGFAYGLTKNLVARGGYAVFYPTDFWNLAADPGYSQGTSYVASLNGGVNPASSLSNPFPSGILPAIGNSHGGLTDVGQSIGGTLVYQRRSQYVEQWSFGFQYSPTTRDVFEASYTGNHAVHIMVGNGLNINELAPQYLALGNTALTAPVANPFFGQAAMAGSSCGLNLATVPAYQLMLPMPQYCDSVGSSMPTLGFSMYDGMELKYTHRSRNLTMMANYTLAKWLDDATPNPGWNDIFFTSVTRNSYDLAAEKSEDEWDIPNAAVVSFIYQLPVGRGQKFGSNFSKVVNGLLGGWQVSAINTFKQGTPTAPQGNVYGASLFGGSQHVNVVGNPNVAGSFADNPGCVGPAQVHTVQHWFNPCAFAAADPGTFGDAARYLSNVRTPGYAFTDLAIEKWFNYKERIRAQFRTEMFNALNHPILGEPFATLGAGNFGTLAYADISRQIQLALKIYW